MSRKEQICCILCILREIHFQIHWSIPGVVSSTSLFVRAGSACILQEPSFLMQLIDSVRSFPRWREYFFRKAPLSKRGSVILFTFHPWAIAHPTAWPAPQKRANSLIWKELFCLAFFLLHPWPHDSLCTK